MRVVPNAKCQSRKDSVHLAATLTQGNICDVLSLDAQLTLHAVSCTCKWVVHEGCRIIESRIERINGRPQSSTNYGRSHQDDSPFEKCYESLPSSLLTERPVQVKPHNSGVTRRESGHEEHRQYREDGVEERDCVGQDECEDPEDYANAKAYNPCEFGAMLPHMVHRHNIQALRVGGSYDEQSSLV